MTRSNLLIKICFLSQKPAFDSFFMVSSVLLQAKSAENGMFQRVKSKNKTDKNQTVNHFLKRFNKKLKKVVDKGMRIAYIKLYRR